MPYLLGIDNGTTVSKAALFDLEGHELATAGAGADTLYPYPGWTERSMEQLWQTTAQAVRAVLAQSGVNPREIVAIGNTGHGNGLYLLDKHGQPARNGIQSLDIRAADILEARKADDIQGKAFPYILQAFWPGQPQALLPWIKANEPDVYARIGHVLLCKDYIKYRLTGVITTDYTDMSGTGLLDNAGRRYSRGLLELYGIPEILDALPPLALSHEIIGRVTAEAARATGLAEGTPVAGGMFDVDAGAVGSGVIEPGTLCIIAGSWSINEVLIDRPVEDRDLAMVSIAPIPDRWLVLEASATSATNLEWFVQHFCGDERQEAAARGVSVFDIINEKVAGLPPGGGGVFFHPFLYGSNVQVTARAGFYGVAGWHTKAHLLRALYEGVVYSHLSHVDKLRKLGPLSVARITGGGARSPVWTQIFADALDMTMEVAEGGEVSARGAAMAAGIAVGVYRDYADAVRKAVRVIRRQPPNAEHTPRYLERYQIYRELLEVMQRPWERISRLANDQG